jgi:MarR family transcriptional regulator, organic hydroperoxide resistance regulator
MQATARDVPYPASAAPAATATDLAGDIYALIVYLHKHCNHDLFEAVGTLELSLTQIKLLHHLDDASSPMSLKEAAEYVHVSLPAASRLVEDLVRRGFVERNEDAEDRRMKRVRLTENGGAVIRRLNAARLNGLAQFAQTLSQEEHNQLAGALFTLMQREDLATCRPEEALQ